MEEAGRNDEPILQDARISDKPCASCGSANVMTIRMSFEGSPVTVLLCTDCESHVWNRDGEPIDLDRLLPAMRSTSKRR